MSETVQIVIPAYRAEATLGAALRSVLEQDWQDWTAVVVDDASPDATGEAFHEAAGVDARFRYLRREANGGPARARNEGVAAGSGTWLAFLDGDDAWLPWRLRIQMELAERYPDVVLWCGEAIRWDGRARPTNVRAERSTHRAVSMDDFIENNPVATSTVVLRRDVFEHAGGFDPSFRGPEDLDLWLRVASSGEIRLIEAPISLYREAAGSLSMDDRTFLPDVLRVWDKAFGPGGALEEQRACRRRARSAQFWNASWMAFARGDRRRALRLLAWAWVSGVGTRGWARRAWLPLAWRYAVRHLQNPSGRPPLADVSRGPASEKARSRPVDGVPGV